jgi:hypothetical protein
MLFYHLFVKLPHPPLEPPVADGEETVECEEIEAGENMLQSWHSQQKVYPRGQIG